MINVLPLKISDKIRNSKEKKDLFILSYKMHEECKMLGNLIRLKLNKEICLLRNDDCT